MEAQQCVQLTGTNRSSDFNALINRWPDRAQARQTRHRMSGTSDQKGQTFRCLIPDHRSLDASRHRSSPAWWLLARCQRPDPIPNSAVKHLSAHGTVSQDPGESVAARPAKNDRVKPGQTPDPSRPSKASPIHSITIVTCFSGSPTSVLRRPSSGTVAGWSSPVARQAHNLKAAGSNPAPATNFTRHASAIARDPITRPPRASRPRQIRGPP